MQKITRITSLLAAVVMIVSLFPSPIALAAGNRIFVTPASGSYQIGQSFTVQVKGEVATENFYGADKASGTLQFPANILKVTSASTAGSRLNWQSSATPGNGTVAFDGRAIGYFNNETVLIMSVTFQVIASGTANIGFSSATQLSSSFGAVYPTALAGGSYSIAAPPPTSCPSGQIGTPPNCTNPPPATCPAGQTGTPPNCKTPAPAKCPTGQTGTPPNCKTPTPSAPSTPKPATPAPSVPVTETPSEPIPEPQENGLSISDATTNRSYKSSNINWKTSSPAKNTVTYGTSLRQLDKTAETKQDADGSYTAALTDLTPGKRYYFTIASESEKDASKTSTYSGVFTTKGYPVSVLATQDGKPASNAKVKIGEQTYSTDREGKIAFELATGSYAIEITAGSATKKFTLAVAEKTIPEDGKAPDAQKFTFDVTPESGGAGGLSPIAMIGIGTGVLAGLGLMGGGFILWRRRKAQATASPSANSVDNDYTWAAQQPLPAFSQGQQAEPVAADPSMLATAEPTLDIPYAAPPDMLPPEEIMPPEQMAITPPDAPPIMAPPPPDESSAYSTVTEDVPPAEQALDAQGVPISYPATAESVPDFEQTMATEQQNTEPETEPETALEIAHIDPEEQALLEETGLNEAPPATTSGKGELQIEHHAAS